MPLKPEDVLKALEVDTKEYDEAPEPIKAFVENFSKKWKRAEDVPDVDAAKGKWNNVLRGQIKKLNKEYDLGLEMKDDDDPVDHLPEIAKRVAGKHAATIADLNQKLKGNVPEAAAKELETKLHQAEQRAKDNETLLTGLTQKYEGLQKSVEQEKVKMWEDGEWDKASARIEWKQDTSDFEKKGFLADQRSKYRIGKDDKGATRTTDADGNPIEDPTKPAKYKSLDELLIENAKGAKLWKVHEKGGQRVNNVVLRTNEVQGGPPMQKPAHRLHPSLQQ